MKKYSCMLLLLGALTACSKKNDSAPVPQHNIVAEVEGGYNSSLTIMETVNGKTTKVYDRTGDNLSYKFTAPVGAELKITASGSYDTTIIGGSDLAVTDNSNPVPNIQNNYDDNSGYFTGQVTFTISK